MRSATILTVALAALIAGCDGMAMRIEYGFSRAWIDILVRPLGPTTSIAAGARGTLPQPAPSNANAFFVAPNGSDANPGTQAAPFLTVAFGAAALTAGRPTLVLIRNGFVGDLVFPVTGVVTFAANRNMQAAVGEAPTVACATASALFVNSGCYFNGFHITAPNIAVGGNAGAGTFRIENCSAPNMFFAGIGGCEYSLTVRSCYFRSNAGSTGIISATYNSATLFDSCAFIGSGYVAPVPSALPAALFMSTNTVPSLNQTVTLTRCVFANLSSAWSDEEVVARAAPGHLLQFDACVLVDVQAWLAVNAALTTHNLRLAANYTRNGTQRNIVAMDITSIYRAITSVAIPVGVTVSLANPLDTGNPPLFTDYAAALAGDPAGLRLQVYGRSVSGPGSAKYGVTSPLYDAAVPLALGTGRGDAAPWAETLSGPSASFQKSHNFAFDPRTYSVTADLVNPIETTDVNGNLHADYDAERRIHEFAYPAGTHLDARDSAVLREVYRDTGVKLVYPRGVNGNVFVDQDDTPIALTGDWVEATRTLTLVAPIDSLVPDNWRGWIVETGLVNFLRIESNDAVSLVLDDPFGFGTPGVNVPGLAFWVRAALVTTPVNTPIQLAQSTGYTGFTRGGVMSETSNTQAPYAFEGLSLRFVESSDAYGADGF
jgi:hypothetical protein